MIQTSVYPLRDRTCAFCRGFKTFHPFVEVAKEGLTRQGLDQKTKGRYQETVNSQRMSAKQELELRTDQLFKSKLCTIYSVAVTSIVGFYDFSFLPKELKWVPGLLFLGGIVAIKMAHSLAKKAVKSDQEMLGPIYIFTYFSILSTMININFKINGLFNPTVDLILNLAISIFLGIFAVGGFNALMLMRLDGIPDWLKKEKSGDAK